MRDYKETIQWYEDHTPSDIGFDPDGMCLKICRTARVIGSLYPSAKVAQDATPTQYRVHNVRDLRRGMVLYFDDPNDSNKYGHIVTMIGRVKGYDPNSLHDILVETNSVVSNSVVVVRGDYFQEHWGDHFQFGAFWLNGQVLDYPMPRSNVWKFWHSGRNWNVRYLDAAAKNGRREVRQKIDRIEAAVDKLPTDKRNTRVMAFRDYFAKNRILKMDLLNEAVAKGGREGAVKQVRDELRTIIKSLPKN